MAWEDVERIILPLFTQVPLCRAGKLEEIADAIAFLASTLAGYITGINLRIDRELLSSLWNSSAPPTRRVAVRPKDFQIGGFRYLRAKLLKHLPSITAFRALDLATAEALSALVVNAPSSHRVSQSRIILTDRL